MPYVGFMGKLLSVRETAQLLSVPERTLRERWQSWGLTGYKVGRAWKFREREVIGWLEDQRARKESAQ